MKCTFVSIWNDETIRIETSAEINEAGVITSIEPADLSEDELDELLVCDRELVEVNGKEYEVEPLDTFADGNYIAIGWEGRKMNEAFWNAVDIVCGECYGMEETCETCPVRIMCDEKKEAK